MNLEDFYPSSMQLRKEMEEIEGLIKEGEPLHMQLAERTLMYTVIYSMENGNQKFMFLKKIRGGDIELSGTPSMQKLCYGCREFYPVISGKLKGYGEMFIMCPQDGIQTIR